MALVSMTEHQPLAEVAQRNMAPLAQSNQDTSVAIQIKAVPVPIFSLTSKVVHENGIKRARSCITNGEISRTKLVPELVYSSETTLKSLDAEERGTDPNVSTGRWTQSEHEAFLQGLAEFGREWKKVAERIQTRNSAQVSVYKHDFLFVPFSYHTSSSHLKFRLHFDCHF
jgi:hypothetical protein